MKLYKTSGMYLHEAKDAVTGEDVLTPVTNVAWAGSQAEAASQRKHLNSDKKIPRDQISTEEVEVPTDKKGLLAWLNAQTFA